MSMTIFCEQCEIQFPRSFETAMQHRERARRRGWRIEVRKGVCTCPPCLANQIGIELKSKPPPSERRVAELRNQLRYLALVR